jgi:hypothetical protein
MDIADRLHLVRPRGHRLRRQDGRPGAAHTVNASRNVSPSPHRTNGFRHVVS